MLSPRERYRRVFKCPHYNSLDGAAIRLSWALRQVPETGSLLDVGAGRGRFLRLLREHRPGLMVASCDLEKFHDEPGFFFECDLTSEWDLLKIGRVDTITCLDVLEHLPEHDVRHALQRFRMAARRVILTVANHSEMSPHGELHLTQRPVEWWRDTIVLDGRMPLIAEETLLEGRSWGFVAQGLM